MSLTLYVVSAAPLLMLCLLALLTRPVDLETETALGGSPDSPQEVLDLRPAVGPSLGRRPAA